MSNDTSTGQDRDLVFSGLEDCQPRSGQCPFCVVLPSGDVEQCSTCWEETGLPYLMNPAYDPGQKFERTEERYI